MTARIAIIMSSIAATLVAAGPQTALAAGSPPPIPAKAQEAAVWFIVIDGQQVGPLTESAVARRIDEGTISADTLVWREGMGEWVRVAESATFIARRVEAAMKKPRSVTPTDNKFVARVRF